MIRRITGTLVQVNAGEVEIDVQGIGYCVFVAPSAAPVLRNLTGQSVTLYTLYDISGSSAGGTLTPRLVGFLDPEEREFYEQLRRVDGMGPIKALRVLVQSPRKIARAIEDGDVRLLRQLPEVGARTADKIVAELKGKVGRFAAGEPSVESGVEGAAMPEFKREALAVLTGTGMSRTEALMKIERALQRRPDIENSGELIAEAFRQTKKEN